MAYSGTKGSYAHSCLSYCNISGYYNDGFSCPGQFCCGSANVRFCCHNASLDISNAYPEKCRCAMSSCTYLSWDVLLPCIAAALFILLMVTICCCHGCRSCVKCRQVIRRQCLRTNSATVSNGPGESPASLEEGQQHTAGDSTFPNLPPYEFAPPKYESLELTEAPPKYEDIMTPGQTEAHVNSAFADDSDTHDCAVTDESQSRDTILPGTSCPQQGENQSQLNEQGPVTTNSRVLSLLNADRTSCQRLQANHIRESSLTQSPPSHELTPSEGNEVSTSPRQAACQEVSLPDQVRRTPAGANREIAQVLELTDSNERTQEHTV